MAGYGNRTAPDYIAEDMTDEHSNTRLGLVDSHGAYSNPHHKYGSGTTGGAGFGMYYSYIVSEELHKTSNQEKTTHWALTIGNKSKSISTDTHTSSHDGIRLGLHKDTSPYSGATKIGSGSTAGAGYGNKTGSFSSHDSGGMHCATCIHKNMLIKLVDSTVGKIMEKAGHVVHSSVLTEKGRAKRDEAKAAAAAEEHGPFAN